MVDGITGISTRPVPQPRPTPMPTPTPLSKNDPIAIPGTLVQGTSNPTSSSEIGSRFYNALVSPIVGAYDSTVYGKSQTTLKISRQRADLLRKYGYRTWVAVTGDKKVTKKDDEAPNSAMTNARINMENAVRNKEFVSGDVLNRNENWRDSTNNYQTNGVKNFASMDELADKIIAGAGGIPFASLVINAHGTDNNLWVVNSRGETTLANMSGEIISFLTKLKNAELLLPGARITFLSCNIAESEYARSALQRLADIFGIEIIAARKVAYDDAPNISDYVAFEPDPSYKSTQQAPQKSIADIKREEYGNTSSTANATSTASASTTTERPTTVTAVKSKNFKIVFTSGSSKLSERLQNGYPAVYQFILKNPTRTNRILEADAEGDRVLQNALARNDYDAFAREFAKRTR